MKINVTRIGPTPRQFKQDIDFKFLKVKEGLKRVGYRVQNRMQSIIEVSRKRPGGTHRLQNAIKVHTEIIKRGISVGVGRIADLNVQAPYWRLLNYGGMVSPKARVVPGYFGDNIPPLATYKGTGRGHDKFTYVPISSGAPRFFMHVDSPIAPVNYIEKTNAWAATIWRVEFNKATRQTKLHTR